MMEANVQERWIEILLGHQGYVGGAYDKTLEPQLRKAYTQGEQFLSVYTIRPDLTGIHESLREKDERIKDLENKLERISHLLRLEDDFEKIIDQKINWKK